MFMLMPLALFAAGIQPGGQTEPKPGMPMQGMSMMNCPMNLQGTTVAAANTATGISVSLTTKPENVAELRKRVEQMAAMHSGQVSSPAMMQGQMMPGTVKYEAIDNGAKLTRSHQRIHQSWWNFERRSVHISRKCRRANAP
jgi:hypothetical protein